jgi:cellulose biosynthesis protein BcsQ
VVPVGDRLALRRTFAVVNGKGGVGKTSVVANLGGLLAAADHRVLLVDLDPQGNLGEDLGYSAAGDGDGGAGLFQAVSAGTPLQPLVGVRPGLDVVPGGECLHDLAGALYARRQRQPEAAATALANSLGAIAGDYDMVFLDCPPGQDVLQEAALVAAGWALIPTKTDVSSRKGLREVATRFAAARVLNPELALLGVVLFGVNRSAKRIEAEARAAIEAELGGTAPVFKTTIRHVEASAFDVRERGQLVHELERAVLAAPKWYERRPGKHRGDPDVGEGALAGSAGALAGDYQALAEEIFVQLAAVQNPPAAELIRTPA